MKDSSKLITRRPVRNPAPKLSFKIALAVFKGIFKVLLRLEIKGKENLPPEGPVIAVCNHLNLLDPILHIISITPRGSIFMAKEELFNWWPVPLFRILMDIAEAFPVARRGTPEQKLLAIRRSKEVLENGLVFGMYPEGTRSKLGHLKDAYQGVAIIAWQTKAPLIPVAIWGTEKVTGIGWLKRLKVTISFGKPFTLPAVEADSDNENLKELTVFIMQKVAAELPPQYRGQYDPAKSPAELKALIRG